MISLMTFRKAIALKAVARAAPALFLSACNITTDAMSRGALHSAAISEAGGAAEEVHLTEADMLSLKSFSSSARAKTCSRSISVRPI